MHIRSNKSILALVLKFIPACYCGSESASFCLCFALVVIFYIYIFSFHVEPEHLQCDALSHHGFKNYSEFS